MTREEVLAMEPGPEMDREVAERVFGKKVGTVAPFVMIRDHGDDQIERVPFKKSYFEVSPDILRAIKPYSTVEAAALEVLKALVSSHGDRGVNLWTWEKNGSEWRCGWDDRTEFSSAPTIALAICRAALLAKIG